MDSPPRQPHPFALAMEWVAKITTVALEMCLPAIGGQYLDHRFGTNYLGVAGLALGVTVGMWHLLQMTKTTKRWRPPGSPKDSNRGSSARPGE